MESRVAFKDFGADWFDPDEGVLKLADDEGIGEASRYQSVHPFATEDEAKRGASAYGREQAHKCVKDPSRWRRKRWPPGLRVTRPGSNRQSVARILPCPAFAILHGTGTPKGCSTFEHFQHLSLANTQKPGL